MASKAFSYAAFALRILEKLLGSRFSVTGIENLPKQPILFVANHFTRSETFFIPYILYKHTGRQLRCLADSSLYRGILGRLLNSVGTISTKNPNRDNIILKDLITAEYDWMIYPEGSMIKSKEIRRESGFVNYTPSRVGKARTGSAVLALKSQLYRDNIIEAFRENDTQTLEEFRNNMGIEYKEYFQDINTCIVPLNITYYPIRPGNNTVKKLVARLVRQVPKQLAEELEIEGNILLGADINISFGNPINLGDYTKSVRALVYQIPIIKKETKSNLILKYFKYRLTDDFMEKIYSNIQVNLDHIFAAVLYHFKTDRIEINHLKRMIYISAGMIQKCGKYRLNRSLFEENLIKMFIDEPHEEFDSIFSMAKSQGLIKEDAGVVEINRNQLNKRYDFQEIRLENTLQVMMNEFLLLEMANKIVATNVDLSSGEAKERVFEEIKKRDLEIFDADYQIYFDEDFSKDKSVGAPFFLDSSAKASARIKKVGILLCHGYKSAPREVEPLAKFLNGFGFKIYAARLKGHGTSPINMKDVTWQDWYDSLQRGYAALSNICTEIIIVGFSTGGLLGLLSCARKQKNLCAIVAINSALKLNDIKARMVPGINLWNELLEKINVKKGRFEYIDDAPENPHINYSRNYLRGVEQLEVLMKNCEENLYKITTPALIIQADNDPVVNPISGKIIFENIKSRNKILSELDFSNHVIINCSDKEKTFESIRNYLHKLNLL